MKVEIRWENEEKSVIRYTYSGVWNWDEFYTILNQRDRIPPEQRVSALVDLRQVSGFPSDAILHLKGAAQASEEIKGIVVLLTNSTMIATLFKAFSAMYTAIGGRFRLVDTEAEAYAILGITPIDDQS